MKKIILLALCLCLLSGCTPAPSPAKAVQPVIDIQTVTDSFSSDDGTVLLRTTAPSITLTLADTSVAQTINAHLSRRVEARMSGATDLIQYARDEYHPQSSWNSWLCQLQAQSMRLDETVLSVYLEYSEFTGGNHPALSIEAITYDCKTGQVLELADLLADGHSPKELAVLVNEALYSSQDALYDDYEALVGKAFADGDLPCWYLSGEGLCFAFAPYVIGSYASGIITATVSYEKLAQILQPGYL